MSLFLAPFYLRVPSVRKDENSMQPDTGATRGLGLMMLYGLIVVVVLGYLIN
jgi:hypothetical protein